ncbi:MAG: 4Fe-4S ferredoxin [Desulfobacca sp.]|nr:4Fe-4S ferredoxin [Desulfobacca sp.]
MSKYYLSHDPEKCIACYSCEVHCKTKNTLPVGPRFCQIMVLGPKMVGDLPKLGLVFMPCFHCEIPWCVSACPTGAMQKRSKDGIVFVEPDLCVGCKSCITACPWGAPQWNPETGKVIKCDYCRDRIDVGLKPACVTKCLTQCLDFGPSTNEAIKQKRDRFAKAVAFQITDG